MDQSNNSIRAIIFDFGGVLIDWNPRYLYRKLFTDENAMEQFFTDIGFGEWNLEQDRGRTFAEAVALHSEKFPHYADHIRAYPERYLETIGGDISETVAILRALKRAGYPLYGLSNWSAETFALTREQFDFFGLFDAIVLSGEVRLIKPDQRIFEMVLQQAGRSAKECLFIDDSETNISAARALGFQTIRYASPDQLERELKQLGIEYE